MSEQSNKQVRVVNVYGKYVSTQPHGKHERRQTIEYRPRQFKVVSKEDIKLYNPNVVSKKRRIISA